MSKLITIGDVDAINYAFDITDPDLISAIVTERGVIYPPLQSNLEKLLGYSSR
jgi:methylthioribose-1-phosphate isomerase